MILFYIGLLAAVFAVAALLAVRPLPTSKVNKLSPVRAMLAIGALHAMSRCMALVSIFDEASYYWALGATALMAALSGALLYSVIYERSLEAQARHNTKKVIHHV